MQLIGLPKVPTRIHSFSRSQMRRQILLLLIGLPFVCASFSGEGDSEEEGFGTAGLFGGRKGRGDGANYRWDDEADGYGAELNALFEEEEDGGTTPRNRNRNSRRQQERRNNDKNDNANGGGRYWPSGTENDEANGESPGATLWADSVGPFLYTFENELRPQTRNVWRSALGEINGLRKRMGPTFRALVWDDRLAAQVRGVSFTAEKASPITLSTPVDGVGPNLALGVRTALLRVLHSHVECERASGQCRVRKSTQRRVPAELVDFRAQRIGCTARLFKGASERRLSFAVLCTTNRGRAAEQEDLFPLRAVTAARLRRKLNQEAADSFDGGEEGAGADGGGDAAVAQVQTQQGDIVRAQAVAIVDPLNAKSLSTQVKALPATGAEAVRQVRAANSLLDLVDLGPFGMLNQRNVQRRLNALSRLIDGDRPQQRAESAEAKKKIAQWLSDVADSQKWTALEQEAKKRSGNTGNGPSVRIAEAAGSGLAAKLRGLTANRELTVGDAVDTDSFDIRDKYFAKRVIHTVPPNELRTQKDSDKLAECFKRVLDLAAERAVSSVAFPEMMPPEADEQTRTKAARIGVEAVFKWLTKNAVEKGKKLKSVIFTVYNEPKMAKVYSDLVGAKQSKQKSD